MREARREWEGWAITASRVSPDAPIALGAERGGTRIILNRQYRRVLDGGSWREPTDAEAQVLDSPATSEAITELMDAENAERDARQAQDAAQPITGCANHPERPATHRSQDGRPICGECYDAE